MLKQRIITALVLVSVLLASLWLLPARAFAGLLVLVFAAGAWEWTTLCGLQDTKSRLLFVDVVVLLGLLCWWLGQDMMLLLAIVAALWWCWATWLLLKRGPAAPLLQQPRALLGIGALVLSACMVALPSLLWLPGDHRFYVLWFIALVAAADIGAYFAGRAFGKHKLAPAISPNKTWEGVVGGMLATLLVAFLGLHLEPALPLDQVQWPAVVVFAVLLSTISVVGDLFESLLKRQRQLKDSGTWLPGHGGVMDRLDSISAALPVYVLLLTRMVTV